MLGWLSGVSRISTDLMESLIAEVRAMWPWEFVAVVALVMYLILAVRQSIACWMAAIIGTTISAVLFYRVGLYMEAALQLFYIGMAIYGWRSWSAGSDAHGVLPVTNWPLAFHLPLLALITVLTISSGWLLSAYTTAKLPYVDSFTTWGGVTATWMVARKILQNWHYWFIIDSVSLYLYSSRGLWLMVALFVLYLILIVVGYRSWSASLPGANEAVH